MCADGAVMIRKGVEFTLSVDRARPVATGIPNRQNRYEGQDPYEP
jgi:hypothetical protein